MARSTKKGAFVDGFLMSRVEGNSATRKFCAPGRGVPPWSRMVVHYRGAQRKNLFRCTLPEYGGEQVASCFTRNFKGHSMRAATEVAAASGYSGRSGRDYSAAPPAPAPKA